MKKFILSSVIFFFTIYTFAQCNVNSHSTSWFDAWISCETSPNPKSEYGNTHWIMYDLGYEYTLHDAKLWNINDPAHLNYGIKDYEVDYSSDGTNWTHFGTYTLDEATGMPDYYGAAGPHFGGISARYLLITPTSNYGGPCYGFAELRINLTEAVSTEEEVYTEQIFAYPNPVDDKVYLYLSGFDSREKITYKLYDLTGRKISENTLTDTGNPEGIEITDGIDSLTPGIYFIKVEQNGHTGTVKIIKE